MDEAKISKMRYNDLLSYAKELGINNFGKYTGKPEKETIMEKIKEHFDSIDQHKVKINTNKTPKKAVDILRTVKLSPPEQLQQRQSKRQSSATATDATPIKLVKKNVEHRLDQIVESANVVTSSEKNEEENNKKNIKKSKKNSKKEKTTEEESEVNAQIKTKKTKKNTVEAPATEPSQTDQQPLKQFETENKPITSSIPDKVSRRKHAVVTYKEDTVTPLHTKKTKLRNDEPKQKNKKANKKDSSGETASNDHVVNEEKEKKVKKKSKEAKVERNTNQEEEINDSDSKTDEKKTKKTKKVVKKKKDSTRLENEESDKNSPAKDVLLPLVPHDVKEAINDESSTNATSSSQLLTKRKHKKTTSSRTKSSLPKMVVTTRLLQLVDDETVPSPSTHALVVDESPMNIVAEEKQIDTASTTTKGKMSISQTTATPKTQSISNNNTVDKTKMTLSQNTPASIEVVVQNQEINIDVNEDEKNLSDEIRLEFNEDDDEEELKEENQVQKETVNRSILTDDDDDLNKENEPEANITRDVLNATVDKSYSVLPCTSFYKSSTITGNNNPSETIATAANFVEKAQELTVEPPPPSQATTTTSNLIEIAVKPQPSNPTTGRAKIVRPTQKVETIETIQVAPSGRGVSSKIAEEVIVVKKTVEIVNREAGPRIVKPCAATVSGADEDAPIAKKKLPAKVKSTSKMPDFKAIHERNANKLESITDFAERKAAHKSKATATKSPHITKQMSLAVMIPSAPRTATTVSDSVDNNSLNQRPLAQKTPMSKFASRVRNYLVSGSSVSSLNGGVRNNNIDDGKVKEGTTPKVSKTGAVHAMQSMASSVINTFIPRFKNNNNKEPSTPKQQQGLDEIQAKTPAQQTATGLPPKTPTNKPSTITNLFQSAKKSAMKKQSLNGEGSTAAPSMSSLLASSSFIRRKSYDLNCSVKKPLNYKPHIGKVKPLTFDIEAKTALFKNSLNTNLNETKVVDKNASTNVAAAAAAAKINLDLSKKRTSSIFKSGRVEKKHRDSKIKKEKKRDLNDAAGNGTDENRNPLVA